MEEAVISAIDKFSSLDDFYVGNEIPLKKLSNAIKSYPIDQDDVVLALVDATVFGSAKNGVAIGIKGIYWRNDFMKESEKRFISWNEINNSEIKTTLLGSITIGNDCKIDLSGSKLKAKQLVEILKSTSKSIEEHANNQKKQREENKSSANKIELNDDALKEIFQSEPITSSAQKENYKYYISNYQTNYFFLEAIDLLHKKYSPPDYLSVAPRVPIDPQKINLALNTPYEQILLCVLDKKSKQILVLTNSNLIYCGPSASSTKEINKIGSLEHENGKILADGEIFYKFSGDSKSDEESVYRLTNEILSFIKLFDLNNPNKFTSEAKIKAPVSTCLLAANAELERTLLRHLGIEADSKDIGEDEEVLIQILRKISDSIKLTLCSSIYVSSEIILSEAYSKSLLRINLSAICSILPALSHALDCNDRKDGLMKLLGGAAHLISKNAVSLLNSISQTSIEEQELEVFSAVVEFGIEYSTSTYDSDELDQHQARFTRLLLEFYDSGDLILEHETSESCVRDILTGIYISKEISDLKILFD